MKKKITALLLVMILTLSMTVPSWAGFFGNSAMAGFKHEQPLTTNDLAVISARLNGEEEPEPQDNNETISQQEIVRFLLLEYADLKETQLGVYPEDYIAMADSVGMLDGVSFDPEEVCTAGVMEDLLENTQPLYDAMHAEEKDLFFVDGLAQPIFEYSDPTKPNGDTGTIRFCVYVETNYDTDDDGKLDLVKALVQLPRETLDGMKVPVIYEARPYITGCVNSIPYGDEGYDLSKLYGQPEARVPAGETTTADIIKTADPSDWNYYSPDEGIMDYEDLDWYDYYLVRGFGVVECGGLGTYGSEGFETCGADVEIDAFACVLEWMAGERNAYTDRTGNIAIEAEWYNGSAGMTGRSYAGTTTFGLATVAPVGLKTVVPVAGIASWYEYTNSQGAYTRGPAYTDGLASYCAGRYLDQEDYAAIADKYGNYLYQQYMDQTEANGDYNAHWENRDYTLNADQIEIPALIVHGLNDWNVRTKEFELMYNAFCEAGQDAKLLLHQGAHVTPTQAATRYPDDDGTESAGKAVLVDGVPYDDILNKWYSHYLCDVDNGAELMATVTVQNNVTGEWDTYDCWDEDTESMILTTNTTDEIVLNSDYLQVEGVEEKKSWWGGTYLSGWKDAFIKSSTSASYLFSADIPEDVTLSGSAEVHFTASTDAFEQGLKDPVMMSAMLVDIAPEPFPAFSGSQKVLSKKDVWAGGGLTNFDTTIFKQADVDYKIVSKGWMDLCNPEAGFDSHTAVKDESFVPGETYDYTLYLQPNVYTFEAGHQLLVALFPYDPGLMDYDAFYNVTVDGAQTYVDLPVKPVETEEEEGLPTPVGPSIQKNEIQTGEGITADKTAAAEGKTVTLTVADADQLVKLTVTDSAGSEIPVTAADGVYTFRMPETAVTVKAEYAVDNPFTDVAEDAFYKDAVLWAVGENITAGVSAELFAPEQACDRAQVVTFLWKAAGQPAPASMNNPFADVADNAYYKAAVLWAAEQGITLGTADGNFAPTAPVTRAQFVTFLWRAAGKPAPAGAEPFADVADDSAYAPAVAWAVEQGVTSGVSATEFAPDLGCSRAQVVTFLYRCYAD